MRSIAPLGEVEQRAKCRQRDCGGKMRLDLLAALREIVFPSRTIHKKARVSQVVMWGKVWGQIPSTDTKSSYINAIVQ